MPLTKDCSTEIIIVGGEEPASNLRRGLNGKHVVHVAIADDHDIPSVRDTFETEDVENYEVDEDPLQIFKEISQELRENLSLERHMAMNKKQHSSYDFKV